MLPFIYPGKDIAQLLGDIESADIPDIHKLMFRWTEGFTKDSANLTKTDIERLTQAGVPHRDIVEWANVACTQTWFVMSADGGGIPLEGGDVVGSVLRKDREQYHRSEVETAPGTAGEAVDRALDHDNWVSMNCDNLHSISGWATKQFGFVPNLFKATSLGPQYYPRHKLAIELLSAPQSKSLSPRLHAMVRRMVNRRNRGSYFEETTHALANSHDPGILSIVDNEIDYRILEQKDRIVMQFAEKLVKHAYKATEADAQAFRACGLDDEAYVDVLNTVSIQTSLDRLCNALGIQNDDKPLLIKLD